MGEQIKTYVVFLTEPSLWPVDEQYKTALNDPSVSPAVSMLLRKEWPIPLAGVMRIHFSGPRWPFGPSVEVDIHHEVDGEGNLTVIANCGPLDDSRMTPEVLHFLARQGWQYGNSPLSQVLERVGIPAKLSE